MPIPESYIQSRSRFRARLEELKTIWPGAKITSLPLPDEPNLTIDYLTAEPLESKERLLVLTSGLHGIEGYAGSAVLDLFFDEFAAGLDPRTTGLLVIHAINPWGMEHWERGNSANVDLNRNFIHGNFTDLQDTNHDYTAIYSFLNPPGPICRLTAARSTFLRDTIKNFLQFGPRRIREASLMGQYRYPEGIYFGGFDIQPETAMVMDIYRQGFRDYREVLHLDMHTGYGPRGRMILVTSPSEKTPAAELKKRFDVDLVAAVNPEEFYSIQGDMTDWEYRMMESEFPGIRLFSAACEFGTYGDSVIQNIRSLQCTILQNQLYHRGGCTPARTWIEKEFRELYLPSDPVWLASILADTRRIFNSVVA